jgi:hypothetical protein
VTIKKARAALSHSVFTGISRNHLDRLVTELAEPFRCSQARTATPPTRRPRPAPLARRRTPRNPDPARPAAPYLAWLRLALPHQDLGLLYGVDRSTVSAAIRQIRSLLANRGLTTVSGQRLHTLADVLAYTAAEKSPSASTAPRSRSADPKPTSPDDVVGEVFGCSQATLPPGITRSCSRSGGG